MLCFFIKLGKQGGVFMVKTFLNNIFYFLKEAKTLFKVDLLSNVFSIISIGFIFLILSMIVSGWKVTNEMVEVLQEDAEINVYFPEHFSTEERVLLRDKIARMDGVKAAVIISQEESYKKMEGILGKEAKVLSYFDENPFEEFIEVNIDIQEMEFIFEKLDNTLGIDSVRDNKQVLERLKEVASLTTFLGLLVITAVGISTLIVISHIIRQGIYNNREQINTLKLLGAPDLFIGFPFLLEGLILTLCGGALALSLSYLGIHYVYGQISGALPFIALPTKQIIFKELTRFIMVASIVLGIIGSLFGLSSAKRQ